MAKYQTDWLSSLTRNSATPASRLGSRMVAGILLLVTGALWERMVEDHSRMTFRDSLESNVHWERSEGLHAALHMCADAYSHIDLKPAAPMPADTGSQNPPADSTVNKPPVRTDKPAPVTDNSSRQSDSANLDANGHVYQLKLQNRTGDHNGADALVYVPPNFDPSRPVKVLVYNHGLSTDVSTAFNNSQLKSQMDAGDPNTILVMPEWQTNPDTRDSTSGQLARSGFFANMMKEIMAKTPELQGKTLNDINDFSVFTHSGGYNAAASEIYKNGLYDRVNEVTLLDSLYQGNSFDRWIQDNIHDLAAGKKRFYNFFGDSTNGNSHALANRIAALLRSDGLPLSAMIQDYGNGGQVMRSEDIARSGIVFKRSDVSVNGMGAHGSLTAIYPRQVLQAEQMIASRD